MLCQLFIKLQAAYSSVVCTRKQKALRGYTRSVYDINSIYCTLLLAIVIVFSTLFLNSGSYWFVILIECFCNICHAVFKKCMKTEPLNFNDVKMSNVYWKTIVMVAASDTSCPYFNGVFLWSYRFDLVPSILSEIPLTLLPGSCSASMTHCKQDGW